MCIYMAPPKEIKFQRPTFNRKTSYVDVYTYTACVFICICEYVVCICLCVRICMCMCMYMCMCKNMYMWMCMCMCMYVRTYARAYVCDVYLHLCMRYISAIICAVTNIVQMGASHPSHSFTSPLFGDQFRVCAFNSGGSARRMAWKNSSRNCCPGWRNRLTGWCLTWHTWKSCSLAALQSFCIDCHWVCLAHKYRILSSLGVYHIDSSIGKGDPYRNAQICATYIEV
jgi:hypothetical protein